MSDRWESMICLMAGTRERELQPDDLACGEAIRAKLRQGGGQGQA